MTMAQSVQPTLATTSCLYRSAVSTSLPVLVPLKIRENAAGFASSAKSSSPRSPALSLQARSMENSTFHQEIVRPLENFYPNFWGDRFLTLPFSNLEFESISRQVEAMKETVKDMLLSSTVEPLKNIYLINSLSRLGISYHFENEIEEQLDHLFITLPQSMDNKDYDLYAVGIIFQVFRSHGYKISCDVFEKFRNGDGTFKEELASDIKGMISLNEASPWGVHGELVLDEALAFTTLYLNSLVSQSSLPEHLREYIANALYKPYHNGMPRLEARRCIFFYEKDSESRNDLLLMFAKYDFNRVQMHHQQEMRLLSSWSEKTKIASRFPHTRQRMVENYVTGSGALFEPRFALSRIIVSKWYAACILLDDTYDAYGLFEELKCLSKAVERYDINAVDELPTDYLKNLFEAILSISDEVEEIVSKEGRSFTAYHIKEAIKKLVRTYHIQARWTHERILPPFEEYLENGIVSMGMILSVALVMMGMDEADEDAYQWVNSDAKILRAMAGITRLYNDMQSNEDEDKRGGQLSGIACYMKEYGVSKKEAIEGYKQRIRGFWKDVNEGFMERPRPIARQILMAAFNFAGTAEVFYTEDNGFTKPEISFNEQIKKLLVDPIPIPLLE